MINDHRNSIHFPNLADILSKSIHKTRKEKKLIATQLALTNKLPMKERLEQLELIHGNTLSQVKFNRITRKLAIIDQEIEIKTRAIHILQQKVDWVFRPVKQSPSTMIKYQQQDVMNKFTHGLYQNSIDETEEYELSSNS